MISRKSGYLGLEQFDATAHAYIDAQPSSFGIPTIHCIKITMPVSRMRMRPWLEDRIESKSIAGLVWVDKEKKMFSIPWKHAARHGWEMDKDACLFKQWAIHTGKFKPGETDPDPKTWKANFRCAMNSLPDIEEVKDRSVNKGCGAVRVYRMLQAVSNKKVKKSSTKKFKKNKVDTAKVKAEDQDSCTSLEEDPMQVNSVHSTLGDYCSTDISLSPHTPLESEPDLDPDSTGSFCPSFQVSPLHTPDFEDDEAVIIEMARQLEEDQSQWRQNNLAESFSSPMTQWSENSAEEMELRLYTELTGRSQDLVTYLDPWPSNSSARLPQIMCPL
ncbi:hypothetical protein AGOR_G00021410 [Albula goreensis]|uniref:IRF tryptophan pentad repeat domain-containing protein n=1 Tax=Albula goreensis TaxID=1534307 RepID=A0A8T3E4M6_9TELE|nr:hypothetical protein AGOR_G00021410 [Albula goreensis]